MGILAFDTIPSRILPYITGCPIPVVVNAVREAAIEFCERTHAWREDLAPIDVVAGTYAYDLGVAAPATGEVIVPLVVKHNGVALSPEINVDIRTAYPDDPDTVNISVPLHYQFTEQQTIRLVPVPNESITGGLKIFAALRPLRSATGMDEAVLTKWGSIIEMGALYRLLVMPEKGWSNLKLGEHFGKRFVAACNIANAEARKGFTQRSLGVCMRQFI